MHSCIALFGVEQRAKLPLKIIENQQTIGEHMRKRRLELKLLQKDVAIAIDTSTLGGRIKKYRFEHGLSQEDLATIIGVNESTVFAWENNAHMPFLRKMKLLEGIINPKGLL